MLRRYHGDTQKPATQSTQRSADRLPLLDWVSAWLRDWWQLIYLGAVVLVLALSPASYRAANRPQLEHY